MFAGTLVAAGTSSSFNRAVLPYLSFERMYQGPLRATRPPLMSNVRHSMAAKPPSHSYPTLAAIAALAFIVACVSHEAVGHGGMCIAIGGHVTLLTSVYFRCATGGPVTDAAGPLMNLAVGAGLYKVLHMRRSLSADWRLFLALAMAFNLLWGAGYFIFSAVTNTGDWAFVLRGLALQPSWLWRCLIGVLGVFLYYRSLALIALHLRPGTPLVVPYLVAGAVSCAAALFFAGPVLPAVREAAQQSLGAAVGLLWLAYRNSSRAESQSSAMLVDHSNGWLLVSALVTLGFVASFGRGFAVGGHP
ncbi:MAG: hypothetical protein V4844_18695 [Pseudomonadota bacterium]